MTQLDEFTPDFGVDRLTRKALADQVHLVLRRLIVRRQLAPGQKITESQVAAMLGVSRTPVREAFQKLCYEEFLIDRPGRSPQVSPITVDKVQEIYPLIAVLEGLAVRLACPRLSESDLNAMDGFTREMALHARKRDTEKLVEADGRFHAVLHERSNNSRLKRVVGELRMRMARLEYAFFSNPAEVELSLKRHRKLVRVLRSRNSRAAQKALELQWELGRQALLRIIGQHLPDRELGHGKNGRSLAGTLGELPGPAQASTRPLLRVR